MKLINARTGKLEQIPFFLGEEGRYRRHEEVKVSNRPGQAPIDASEVGFFTHGAERKHVVLTKPQPGQRGVLLRINTEGCYTKGSQGSVTLCGGDAALLTEGTFLYGGVGNSGGGVDQLWHAKGPALFSVYLTGGAGKGYGQRYVFVTKTFSVKIYKLEDLCQVIATDDAPEVTEVAWQYVNQLPEDVQSALALAAYLETVEPSQVIAQHYGLRPMLEIVEEYNLAVPHALIVDGQLSGLGAVENGTLTPGNYSLLEFRHGPLGGKRYRAEIQEPAIYVKIATRGANTLALVKEGFEVIVNHFKDGEPYTTAMYNARGEHWSKTGGTEEQVLPWV